MGASFFVFSPDERAAIARILRDFPAAVQTLETNLRTLLERLIPRCQGRLHSEDDAHYVLTGLADRVVGRTIGDSTDEDGAGGDLRTAAIDLLTRHLLAGMLAEFRRRVMVEPGRD